MGTPTSDNRTIIPLCHVGLFVHERLADKVIIEIKDHKEKQWLFAIGIEDCHSLGTIIRDGAQVLIDDNLKVYEETECAPVGQFSGKWM